MKTSISFLSSAYSFLDTIKQIDKSDADFIHVDVMDGLLVNNRTPFSNEMLDVLKKSPKPKEVHLMTLHLKTFIDVFSYLNPESITYSFESTTEHNKIIKYIKEKNMKVGISISPLTDIDLIAPYLKKVDLIIVMGVIPGYGGQKYIEETNLRIKKLMDMRKKKKAKFLISVDGGVNDKTIEKLQELKLDRVVLGSYVCKSANFNEKINKIKKKDK